MSRWKRRAAFLAVGVLLGVTAVKCDDGCGVGWTGDIPYEQYQAKCGGAKP